MSTTIYYFTGTGNCLKVAKDLRHQLVDAKLVQICSKTLNSVNEDFSEKIGIIYPVYFSGIPKMVKEFLEQLKIHKNPYIFAISTFGGSSGISIKQIEDILNKKGNKLSADFSIQMPGNYQVMYQPLSMEKQQQHFNKENELVIEFANKIKNNEIVLQNRSSNLFGKLIYKTFKPHNKSKNFWVDEKCNGCSLCSKVCPANNIKMNDGKPEWNNQCELCVACMQWCPKKSIQYKKSTIKRGRYHHPNIKVSEISQY